MDPLKMNFNKFSIPNFPRVETIRIKGMVCSRCISILKLTLNEIGVSSIEIELGRIKIGYDPEDTPRALIDTTIKLNGFEIVKDRNVTIGELTKRWVIDFVWDHGATGRLSDYLAIKTGFGYDFLSKNFRNIYDKTIERYCILIKIERSKELIELSDSSFKEIAYSTGYQNLSALSRQFKKETGMTLSEYQSLKGEMRICLDRI